MGGEEADAIGWEGSMCTMIECKTSVGDWKRDGEKLFRRCPEMGIGKLRYYCTEPRLLWRDHLPPRWGLLEWDGRRMRVVVQAGMQQEVNQRKEVAILLSALRRTGTHAPSGVSVKVYSMQTKCRATLSVTPEEAFVDGDSI